MATIEKRPQKNGTTRYRARVRLDGHEQKTRTFSRLTDARDWARSVEDDLKRGRLVPSNEASRRTVADMIERYITHSIPRRPRNRDAKKVAALLGWWKGRIGRMSVANVSRPLIVECRDELLAGTTRRGGPRSPATVNRYLAALSAVFKEAMREWGWVDRNPVTAVGRGAEHPGVIRFLSADEREALLHACAAHSAPWLHPLVLLALSTGARRGELLGLRWPDVDLTRGVVTFHITKNRDRRAVPVAGAALTVLREWAKVRRIDTDLVFPGNPIERPLNIEGPWREALRTAKVEDFRFHDLRHSAASYLAMSGATAPEIAAVLGHKTLQMVKRYAHISDQHTTEIVERMTNKFLPG